MRRCIVHFGMNKTGSSSIQATLYNTLHGSDVHYVDLGVFNPTGPLLDAFMSPQRRFKSIQTRSRKLTFERFIERRNGHIEQLKAELSASSAPLVIISAEGLWRLNEQELLDFYELVFPYFDKIEAIAYVRPPKGFMESNFQQLVKGGLAVLDCSNIYPSYKERFEKFEAVFGRENVQYWSFSPSQFEGNCVVKDFCNRLGIPLEEDEVLRVNEGLSRGATAALFAYRKFADAFPARAQFNRENALLVEKLSEMPGSKLRFSANLVAPVLEEYKDDIHWMESRIEGSLSEDISQYEDQAISTEDDLLSFEQETIDWLSAQVAAESFDESTSLLQQDPPKQVAEWIHWLRLQLADENLPADKALLQAKMPAKQEKNSLNVKKLVREVQKNSPKLKNKISEQEAISLVRGIFSQITQELNTVEAGSINVAGLGMFTVRKAKRDNDGEGKSRKHIVFTT